ncbi:protein of unknown function [Hyphomicrobium sp. 1Nfss2.1]
MESGGGCWPSASPTYDKRAIISGRRPLCDRLQKTIYGELMLSVSVSMAVAMPMPKATKVVAVVSNEKGDVMPVTAVKAPMDLLEHAVLQPDGTHSGDRCGVNGCRHHSQYAD